MLKESVTQSISNSAFKNIEMYNHSEKNKEKKETERDAHPNIHKHSIPNLRQSSVYNFCRQPGQICWISNDPYQSKKKHCLQFTIARHNPTGTLNEPTTP